MRRPLISPLREIVWTAVGFPCTLVAMPASMHRPPSMPLVSQGGCTVRPCAGGTLPARIGRCLEGVTA